MSLRRIVWVVLAAVALSVGLTGCGGNTGGTPAQNAAPSGVLPPAKGKDGKPALPAPPPIEKINP